jgi:hypothetical protein
LKHLAEGDRAALEQMVESAVSKLLHSPTTRLKERAAEGEDAPELAATVRFLFDLQEVGNVTKSEEAASDCERDGRDDRDERLPN